MCNFMMRFLFPRTARTRNQRTAVWLAWSAVVIAMVVAQVGLRREAVVQSGGLSLCFLSSYWSGVVNGSGFFRYMEGLFSLFFFLGAAFGVDSFTGPGVPMRREYS
ncbi:hypothetical protein BC629DRAFT_1053045 [Irpex lacteus]|nr:hypothetical protein BC629DRAFT_1053045 [Irpex lacteus]